MSEPAVLGAVLSNLDVVVDLRPLDFELSIEELADLLQLSVDQVLKAIIHRVENETAMRELFVAVVGPIELEHTHAGMRTVLGVRALALRVGGKSAGSWLAPRAVLRLPYSPSFSLQLEEARLFDPSRQMHFTTSDVLFLEEELKELEAGVRDLRKHLLAERKVLEQNARQVALLEKMLRIVALQAAQHSDAALAGKLVPLGHLERELELLRDKASRVLIDEVREHFPTATHVNLQASAADRLLSILSHEELGRLIGVATIDPGTVPSGLMDRLFSALEDATRLLLMSPRQQDFLDAHGAPALSVFLELDPPGLSEALEQLSDATLREHVKTGWRGVLADISQHDPREPARRSVLAQAAHAAAVYESATSIVVSLAEVFVPQLISRAYGRTGTGMRVSGFLTRLAFVGAMTHKARSDAALALLVALNRSDPAVRLAAIRELRLQDQLFAGTFGVGLALLANTAVFASMLDSDEELSWKRSLELAAASAGFGAATADALQLVAKQRGIVRGRTVLKVSSKALGPLTCMLGLAVTGLELEGHMKKFEHEKAIVDAVALTGGLASLTGWMLGLEVIKSYSAVAAAGGPTLLVIGLVLSTAAVGAALAWEANKPGLQVLFERYLNAVTADGGPLVSGPSGVALARPIDIVRIAFSQARASGAFTAIDVATNDQRSLRQLGLSTDDIATALGIDPALVEDDRS